MDSLSPLEGNTGEYGSSVEQTSQKRPERRFRSQRVMTILVLLLATVLIPDFLKERWLKVLNSHVTLKLKCSGPTGCTVGMLDFGNLQSFEWSASVRGLG